MHMSGDIFANSDSCFLCGNLEHHGGRILSAQPFQIVADIAPLRKGHILISPLEHFYSFSSLSSVLFDEFTNLLEMVIPVLVRMFGGKIVIFEHGVKDTCDVPACGIDHAHMHAVPVPDDRSDFSNNALERFMNALGITIETTSIQEFQELRNAKGESYLFFRDVLGQMLLITSPRPFPPQILRRYIATQLGNPYRYDWQLFYNQREVRATTTLLRSAFLHGVQANHET
jgi:diadenosine tetraphosphate (Ap4A) HIT family hydrolase